MGRQRDCWDHFSHHPSCKPPGLTPPSKQKPKFCWHSQGPARKTRAAHTSRLKHTEVWRWGGRHSGWPERPGQRCGGRTRWGVEVGQGEVCSGPERSCLELTSTPSLPPPHCAHPPTGTAAPIRVLGGAVTALRLNPLHLGRPSQFPKQCRPRPQDAGPAPEPRTRLPDNLGSAPRPWLRPLHPGPAS